MHFPLLPPSLPPPYPQQAADLDQLLAQMGSHPAGKEVLYVFLSRTAAGSSARFASAAAAAYLQAQAERRAAAAAAAAAAAGSSPRLSPPVRAGSGAALAALGAGSAAAPAHSDDASDMVSPSKRQRLSAGSLLRVESDASDLVRWVAGCRGGRGMGRVRVEQVGEVDG